MKTRVVFTVLAMMVVVMVGCEETQRPPAPPPPLPIVLQPKFGGGNGLPSNDVFDVFIDSQNRLWISTDSGLYMEDGQTKVVFNDFDGLPNRKCRGLAERNGRIFVGTWGGGVSYNDGSPTWSVLPVQERNNPGLVNGRVFEIAVDDTSLWVCTADGLSQYIDDDSRTMNQRWVDYSFMLGGTRVVNSCFLHEDPARGPEVWLGTQTAGMIVLSLPNLNSVSAANHPEQGFVAYTVGEGGSMMRYRGSSWRPVTRRTTANLRAVFVLGTEAAHAVGDGGVALALTANGWRARASTTTNNLNGLWAIQSANQTSQNVYCVGDGGTILRYDTRWTQQISPTVENLNGVWASGADNVYAVGDNGTIARRTVGTWQTVVSNASEDLYGVWGSAANNIFAVGDGGTILHFDGAGWSPMSSGTSERLTSVSGTSSTDVYAVGENGVVVRYNGSGWDVQNLGSSELTLRSVWARAGNDPLTVGTLATHVNGSDRVFRFDGATWTASRNGTRRFLKAVRYQQGSSGLPGNEITDLMRDGQTDLIWVSMATNGIASVDVPKRAWSHLTQIDGFQSSLAMSLDMRANGDMWVGTQTGVSRREPNGRITNYTKGSGLPDARVRKVYVSPNNDVWLAFIEGGAGRVKSPDAHK